MEKHVIQQALEALSDDGSDIQVRAYSGRGMYGKECLGAAIEGTDLVLMGAQIIAQICANQMFNAPEFHKESMYRVEESIAEVVEILSDTRIDSLGMGKIVYWEGVEFVGPDGEVQEQHEAEE